jgi:hypothetical protein
VEPAPQPVAGDELVAEAFADSVAVETEASLVDEEFIAQPDIVEDEAQVSDASATETVHADDAAEAPEVTDGANGTEPEPERRSLAQKVRNWLGRAA